MVSSLVKEMRFIEFYCYYVWPIHRKLVKDKLTPRCNVCAISANYSKLDERGVCEICRSEPQRSDKRNVIKMSKELHNILKSHQGKGDGKYDALVLYSGGKDSIYLTNYLKQYYPQLRLLAVTMDNGFMSPVALSNVKNSIPMLDVDHIKFRAKESVTTKMFSYTITHLNKKGCSGTVDRFDGDFLHDYARRIASQLRIPLMISGISPRQVEDILGLRHFESPPSREKAKRTRLAGIKLRDIFTPDEMKYWWDGKNADFNPRVLYPFYAMDYDEEEIKKTVIQKGYVRVGEESPLVTNHQLIPLMGLVDMATFGYSSFEPEFAELVRIGRANRHYWRSVFEILEYSSKTGKFIRRSVDDSLARLNLSRESVGLK